MPVSEKGYVPETEFPAHIPSRQLGESRQLLPLAQLEYIFWNTEMYLSVDAPFFTFR
jgi:hypothetical protein